MPAIVLPEGYSYVLASVASTAWLNAWQMYKVGSARKAAQVKYPQLYAEKAEAEAEPLKMKFNCTQRAHQNTLESLPTMLVCTLLTGLKYPYVAAGLGGGWVLGRVLYTVGYSTGDPNQRNKKGGLLGGISLLSLVLATSYTAYQLVQSEL